MVSSCSGDGRGGVLWQSLLPGLQQSFQEWESVSSHCFQFSWAISTFSPVGLLSSNGLMCVCVSVCVRTEWTESTMVAYSHIYQFIPYYASVYTRVHILKPFEDCGPTGLKVDSAFSSRQCLALLQKVDLGEHNWGGGGGGGGGKQWMAEGKHKIYLTWNHSQTWLRLVCRKGVKLCV